MARTPRLRVIRAEEAGYPGFYRVVWNAHVAEFSELTAGERHECMDAVATVEAAVRRHLQPDKVNLAAIGNMVPHLHWHVIARHRWDAHFPGAIWAGPQRTAPPAELLAVQDRLPELDAELSRSFGQ